MLFEIIHTTQYLYGEPASEAYLETRLTPPSNGQQEICSHSLHFHPQAPTSQYLDYFGNLVEFYSMTLRHPKLTIRSRIQARTFSRSAHPERLPISVAEARQLFSSTLIDFFDYLQPTSYVPIGGPATEWARKFFRGNQLLGKALFELNEAIYKKFQYLPGTTDNSTPLAHVWKQKKGVCQDFTHIMLSIIRTAGIPARYVCGYIESESTGNAKLVGSVATHAWVEALIPGLGWTALDPTNNQWCGQQHVSVSYGRDFQEAAPVRGTFKASASQMMKVQVRMKRL